MADRRHRTWRAAAFGVLLAVLVGAGGFAAFAQLKDQAPALPDPASVSENARSVLERVRPSVVQIKGFYGGNTAEAFHGSGFAVAAGGLLVTNYHVVAEQVLHPDKFRLEYRTPEGRTGKVQVLAIDVRHDLAVVRAEGYEAPALKINAVVPARGARAYSVGFPLDVGLTITEGVSNGRVEDSFDARIHYSGAVNGGMSGGPALNGAGEVIGVNVSGYRFQQLVSFLVPIEHASALIARAGERPLAEGEAKKEVVAQLRSHGKALLDAFAGEMPTQQIAGYALPGRLAGFVDCKAAGDPGGDAPLQVERIDCSGKAGLYVQQGLSTGDVKYAHYVLTSSKLDAWRFAHKLTGLSRATGNFGRPRHMGPFSCRNDNVRLDGFDASLMVCVRSYRRLDELVDITVRVVSLNEPLRGFASHIDMWGVEFEQGMKFVRRYLEAMQWKP